MKMNLRIFYLTLGILSLGMIGCETVEQQNTTENLASSTPDTKDEVTAVAEQHPTAEEIKLANSNPPAEFKTGLPEAREESASNSIVPSFPSATAVQPSPNDNVSTPSSQETSAVSSPPVSPTPKPPSSQPSLFTGHIILMNFNKNFVVIDFDQNGVPPIQSELGVYRNSEFVGSIRITNPIKPPLASADILTGTLRNGDEVR